MPALARTTPLDLHAIHADVWHADALAETLMPVLATGDAVLDAQLPGGGWPIGALTEILQPLGVHNEWRLLLPALARSGAGPVLLVGAPHLPFAPALAAHGLAPERLLWVQAEEAAARLWACEQALRCADVRAVLAWLPQARGEQLRRLHMAAAEYSKLLFVMRPAAVRQEASPAALRVQLQPAPNSPQPGLQLQLLKRRGPPLHQKLQLQALSRRLQLLLSSSQAHALDRPSQHA